MRQMKNQKSDNEKSAWKIGRLSALLSVLLIPLIPSPVHAAGATYYVATYGNDSDNGAISQPFRSIQKCATIAVAGDTCSIREGTSRETITPANSGTAGGRITFAPFSGESVTVNGADVVAAWTTYSGSISKSSSMNWDLGVG